MSTELYPTTEHFEIKTAATVNPITLQEAKDYLGETSSDRDDEITRAISAATGFVEDHCEMAFVERTITLYLPYWADEIFMPIGPLVSINSVKYWNTESPEALATLAATEYRVNTRAASIKRKDGVAYPAHQTRDDAIQIEAVVGFNQASVSPADLAGAVPNKIKQAILLHVSDLTEIKEIGLVGTNLNIHPTAERLLAQFRRYL